MSTLLTVDDLVQVATMAQVTPYWDRRMPRHLMVMLQVSAVSWDIRH